MPTALWTIWEHTAEAAPDAVAVVNARDGLAWSRRELSSAALTLAHDPPAVSGAVVAFSEPNHPRWLAIFLMLQRLGAVALPLDAALPSDGQPRIAAGLGATWLLRDGGTHWEHLGTGDPVEGSNAPDYPADLCLIKTTSGSMGQPRGLAFNSENMLADGRQIISTMGITDDDRNLGAIPLGHSYGLGNLVMPLILQGTAIICSQEILPNALAAQIEKFGATVLPSVPVVLRALAESVASDLRSSLCSLRRVISAGAPLKPEVAVKFREVSGLCVQNFYGSSETGGICFDRTGEATLTGRSIGQVMDGVEVRFDSEARVVVRSAAVMPPGEWTLADLGRWNEHSELVLTGRAGLLVNIGGKKIAPLEVERTLRELEGVSDAWVGVQGRNGTEAGGEEFLLAAIETRRSREEILKALAKRLPAWQIPRRLWVLERLPRTVRGKLDRLELERFGWSERSL